MSRTRPLTLSWASRAGRDCLRITGWPAAALDRFATIGDPALAGELRIIPSELVGERGEAGLLPSMAGQFTCDREAVWFEPRFPFVEGLGYSLVVCDGAAGGGGTIWSVTRPARALPSTTSVLAVYPSAAEVPVNLLRLYVEFSAPMSEGSARRCIAFHDARTGQALTDVLLAGPELWDRGRRRLTLLLDPGRIKRGLPGHERLGYPLAGHDEVVLTVDASFPDGGGRPLAEGVERHYRVGPTLDARVDPARWRWRAPVAGSSAPLRIVFDRPLDYALLKSGGIVVRDPSGARIEGEGTAGEGERSWSFAPAAAWQAGDYALAVDARLEDIAGNSIRRAFDRDRTRPDEAHAGPWVVAVRP